MVEVAQLQLKLAEQEVKNTRLQSKIADLEAKNDEQRVKIMFLNQKKRPRLRIRAWGKKLRNL